MNRDRRRDGSALLVTVILLVLMAMLGLSALDTVTRDRQVAGFLNRKKIAFHAADAGAQEALQSLRTDSAPTLSSASLGDTTMFPHGRPSYRPDPNVADPVEDAGVGGFPGMNLRIGQNGAPQFQMQFWRIHVQGEAPGGTVSRQELASGSLIAN